MSDLGIAPHVYRSKHNHENCRCIKLCEICHKPKSECQRLYATSKFTEEQKRELARFINRESLEQGCNLPDYVIAEFLASAYENLCAATKLKVSISGWGLNTLLREGDSTSAQVSHDGGVTWTKVDVHQSSEGDYLTTTSGAECPLPPGRCNTCRL